MTVKILYRPAEVVEGEWQTLAEVASWDDAADELGSWQWSPPIHGDLVRLAQASFDRLFVLDSDRSGFVEIFGKTGQPSWVEFWDGDRSNAIKMFEVSGHVDRRRLVLAACACAETALRIVPKSETRPRAAIDMAIRWARGEAKVDDVRRAREAADASISYLTSALIAGEPSAYAASSAAKAASIVGASSEHAIRCALIAAGSAAGAISSSAEERSDRLCAMAPLVRRYIPLSVLACSLVGARDPLPIPRDNPYRKARR